MLLEAEIVKGRIADTIITIIFGTEGFANSVEPDQMLQNTASDQAVHGLPYIQQYFGHQQVEE